MTVTDDWFLRPPKQFQLALSSKFTVKNKNYLSDNVLRANIATVGGCLPAGNDTFLDTRGGTEVAIFIVDT